MNESRQAPPSLRIVAVLFILGGVFALVDVLVSFTRLHINLNFGVLGIFIGPGLLRFSRGWRTCALVFLWFALILIPVFALFILGGASPITIEFFGQQIGYASPGAALVLATFPFALALWQYHVLTREDIVQLFYEAVG